MQVRFELIYGSEINYLTIHLHEKVRKDASFDMTLKQEIKKVMIGHEKYAHLNKKKKLIIKTTQNVGGNPREGKKNHGLSKNITFLLGLACIVYEKEISLQ